MNYCDVISASVFTVFVNNGGLKIPSRSVYLVVQYAEKIARFARTVTRFEMKQVCAKQKIILVVCNHACMDTKQDIFEDHDWEQTKASLKKIIYSSTLIKLVAIIILPFVFSHIKRHQESVVTKPMQRSDVHRVLLKNQ